MTNDIIYELAILYRSGDDLDKAQTKVKKIISHNKAKISSEDNWGEKDLAYPIKGQSKAVYIFYQLQIDPQAIAQIQNSLNITEEVIRHLITKIDTRKILQAEQLAKRQSERQQPEEELDPKTKKGSTKDKPEAKSITTKTPADEKSDDSHKKVARWVVA